MALSAHVLSRIKLLKNYEANETYRSLYEICLFSPILYTQVENISKSISEKTICPHITCTAIPSVQNPSLNYQVERLDFNCSQTLSNLTITQYVQRTHNETHAQQYQTFWNSSTNMTYIETPTQIIYVWYSLPGMHIVKESFPHFIEAQFFYTTGATRIPSSDTWQIWLQSICGDLLYLAGTF